MVGIKHFDGMHPCIVNLDDKAHEFGALYIALSAARHLAVGILEVSAPPSCYLQLWEIPLWL